MLATAVRTRAIGSGAVPVSGALPQAAKIINAAKGRALIIDSILRWVHRITVRGRLSFRQPADRGQPGRSGDLEASERPSGPWPARDHRASRRVRWHWQSVRGQAWQRAAQPVGAESLPGRRWRRLYPLGSGTGVHHIQHEAARVWPGRQRCRPGCDFHSGKVNPICGPRVTFPAVSRALATVSERFGN
jgi:hypothetical protein